MPINTVYANLLVTYNLVKYQGTELVLHRLPGMEDDGAGGRRPIAGVELVLPPQKFYLGGKINNRMNNMPFEAQTTEGELIRKQYVVIGMPRDYRDMLVVDIKENDWFFDEFGHRYDIAFVDDDRQFQTKAEARHTST